MKGRAGEREGKGKLLRIKGDLREGKGEGILVEGVKGVIMRLG